MEVATTREGERNQKENNEDGSKCSGTSERAKKELPQSGSLAGIKYEVELWFCRGAIATLPTAMLVQRH